MSYVAKGGKNIFGVYIGILMLETHFPRIPGELGNATSFNYPVRYHIVKGASPHKVVREKDPALLNLFIKGAQELEKFGVRAITTNCGFLAQFQQEIANAVNVPFFSSSLMQIPMIYRMLKKDQKVGVLTVNSASLTPDLFEKIGADGVPLVIKGLENKEEFTHVMLDNVLEMNVDKAKNENVEAAKELVRENPDIGAIVLECTNMPPYGKAIQEAIQLPVFDIFTLTDMIYNSLVKQEIHGYM
jgi:aspartate/glutamate racemase